MRHAPLFRALSAALALVFLPGSVAAQDLIATAEKQLSGLPATAAALDETLSQLARQTGQSGPAQRLFKQRLTSGTPSERRALLHALGAHGTIPDALKPEILSNLRSSDLLVQLAATWPGLQTTAYRKASAGLARQVITGNAPVIARDVFDAARIGGDPGLDFVQAFSRLNGVRMTGEQILAAAGYDPQGTRRLLMRRLTDERWWVRVNAAGGLARMDLLSGAEIGALFDTLGGAMPEADFAIYRAIGQTAGEANGGIARLKRHVESGNDHRLLGALYALAHLTVQAPASLIEAVEAIDPADDAIARQKKQALAHLGA